MQISNTTKTFIEEINKYKLVTDCRYRRINKMSI